MEFDNYPDKTSHGTFFLKCWTGLMQSYLMTQKDSYSCANLLYNKQTQKKKVYSTLFKKTGLSQTMRDVMGMDYPPPVRHPPSTCPFALSMEKGPVTKFSNNIQCIEKGVVHDKKVHVCSCQQSGASRKIDSDVESFGDDSNAHRVQPHSKSSLLSARAFFRYLDSNHNLTILHQN